MQAILSHIQLERIDDAEIWAATLHKHQLRKDGSPYAEHVRSVACHAVAWAVRRLQLDSLTLADLYIACLCHDLVEDQGVQLEEVEQRFGRRVRELVGWVSNRKDIEDADERLQEYCERLQLAPNLAAVIKLADLYHNAHSRPPNPRWALNWAGKKAPKMLDAIHAQTCHFPEYALVYHAIARMRKRAEVEMELPPIQIP